MTVLVLAGRPRTRSDVVVVPVPRLDPVAGPAAVLAVAVTLLPTLLPRSPLVQAALSALVAVQVYVAVAVAAALVRRLVLRRASSSVAGLAFLATSLVVLTACAAVGFAGQEQLADAVDVTAPTPVAYLLGVVGGLALTAGVVLAARASARAVRHVVGGATSRGLPRRRAAVVTLALVPALLGTGVVDAAPSRAPAVDGQTAEDGRRGRDFVDLAPSAAQITDVTHQPAQAPVRVYVGVHEATSPVARARLAVDRLERSGAFERDVLAVVVPTGTGWVNPASPAALELLHGGDTATLAVQYATTSSYATYVRGTTSATTTAADVVAAVRARADEHAAAGVDVARVVVYGESLGAIAGLRALDRLQPGAEPDSLWVGVPGEARYRLDGHRRSLLHADDPVAAWSPDVLWRPTPTWSGPWLPVVSFWQGTADLLGARFTPTGRGHRYGGELVDAWAAVAPPEHPLDVAATGRVRDSVVAVAVAHP